MLTIEESIQQLNQFFILKPLANRMRQLNNRPDNTVDIVESLRLTFKDYFNREDSERYIRGHLSLKDVTYNALVALASFQPLNDIDSDNRTLDPISTDPIEPENHIAFSTGYLYNYSTIQEWRLTRIAHSLPFTDPIIGNEYALQDRVALIKMVLTKERSVHISLRENSYYLEQTARERRYRQEIALEVERRMIGVLPENRRKEVRDLQETIEQIKVNPFSQCLNDTPEILQTRIEDIWREYRLKQAARKTLRYAQDMITAEQVEMAELMLAWNTAYDAALAADKLTQKNYQLGKKIYTAIAVNSIFLGCFSFLLSVNKQQTGANIVDIFWLLSMFSMSAWLIRQYVQEGNEAFTAVNHSIIEAGNESLDFIRRRRNTSYFFRNPVIPYDEVPEEESVYRLSENRGANMV